MSENRKISFLDYRLADGSLTDALQEAIPIPKEELERENCVVVLVQGSEDYDRPPEQTVGLAVYEYDEAMNEIIYKWIYVLPEYRHQGLGTEIFADSCDRFHHAGIDTVSYYPTGTKEETEALHPFLNNLDLARSEDEYTVMEYPYKTVSENSHIIPYTGKNDNYKTFSANIRLYILNEDRDINPTLKSCLATAFDYEKSVIDGDYMSGFYSCGIVNKTNDTENVEIRAVRLSEKCKDKREGLAIFGAIITRIQKAGLNPGRICLYCYSEGAVRAYKNLFGEPDSCSICSRYSVEL